MRCYIRRSQQLFELAFYLFNCRHKPASEMRRKRKINKKKRNAWFLHFCDADAVDQAAAKFALELLDSDDSDEEPRRTKKARNDDFFEKTIASYTDKQFEDHFILSRAIMDKLLNVLGHHFECKEVPSASVPLKQKLLFTIWLLSKQESFLAVGNRFDMPTSSGHGIFKSIIGALAELMPDYVKWPTAEQQNVTSQIFEQRSRGIPGVIGAIGGCHIPIKAPTGNKTDYFNRSKGHSIILQGVCDHAGSFIDVFIGMPGRMHDAEVFRNSDLFAGITDSEAPLIADDAHLIGDKAYPLMMHLLTPLRDDGHLSAQQQRFNTRLSDINMIIKRTFGLLVGKFRRLKYLDIAEAGTANTIIAAAVMLFNFYKKHNEDDSGENDIEIIVESDEADHADSRPTAEAIFKRNRIIDSL